MTLGYKIKIYRKKLNLTQEELAISCNLSRNAIYNYENGKRTPDIETLGKISKILNVDIQEFLKVDTTFSEKLINFFEEPIFRLYNSRDTLRILSEKFEINHTEIANAYAGRRELPIEMQQKLLSYAAEIDLPKFIVFAETNRKNIPTGSVLHDLIDNILSNATDKNHIEDSRFEVFKKYLYSIFGTKIVDIEQIDLLKLFEDSKSFLEFSLYKMTKENYDKT